MTTTIREQFVKAVERALEVPHASEEIQASQRALAKEMAANWIEFNCIQFRLFKLGHEAGREANNG